MSLMHLPVENHGHQTSDDVRKNIGELEYSKFNTFAVFRNPFDRFLSAYSYLRQQKEDHRFYLMDKEAREYVNQFKDFEDFCLNAEPFNHLHFMLQSIWLPVDKIYCYERLNEEIFNDFGVHLPVINKSNHLSWGLEYNFEMRRRVEQLYYEDFKIWRKLTTH